MDRCTGEAIKEVRESKREREIATQSLITGCWLWGFIQKAPKNTELFQEEYFFPAGVYSIFSGIYSKTPEHAVLQTPVQQIWHRFYL